MKEGRKEGRSDEERRAAQVKSRDPHQTWWGKTKKLPTGPEIMQQYARSLICLITWLENYIQNGPKLAFYSDAAMKEKRTLP